MRDGSAALKWLRILAGFARLPLVAVMQNLCRSHASH